MEIKDHSPINLIEYSVADILSESLRFLPLFLGTFEGTEDPDVEWPHRHSFYSAVWFTEGEGFYIIDSIEYEIKARRVFFVNPKQVHNWDYSINSKGYIVVVDASIGLELNINYDYPFIDVDSSQVTLHENLLTNLIEEFERKDAMSEKNTLIGIQYYHQLLQRIASQNKISPLILSPMIGSFKDFILNDTIHAVEYYAEKMNVSAKRLNSECRSSVGVSAKQYILNLKLVEAKRLLIYSSQNINEISYQIGFEDSSYFARIFKKKTSLSPTEFIKKYRKHT